MHYGDCRALEMTAPAGREGRDIRCQLYQPILARVLWRERTPREICGLMSAPAMPTTANSAMATPATRPKL